MPRLTRELRSRSPKLGFVERLEPRQLLTTAPWQPADPADDAASGCCPLCGTPGCTARHDAAGNTYYVLPTISPAEAAAVAASPSLPASAALPLDQTFKLHSRPGAEKTIYLDFDGHVTNGTAWSDARTKSSRIVSPAYDTDGLAGFSTRELLNIQEMWQRVVEDFSPFDVNVTTEAPPVSDLINSGTGDARYGIRVVIGGNNRWLGASAGGVAYLTSFNWNSDTPCFVFSENLSNGAPKACAEAISHEVGHTLGLTHDGEYPERDLLSYYTGHGTGATGWAPIMGVGYSKELVQWSQGEYSNANNQQDDLAIITSDNGFGYRPDDYGSTAANARLFDPIDSMTIAGSDLVSWTLGGVVEQRTDVDVFTFTTAGRIVASILPAPVSPNLDILAEILDSAGTVVGRSNPLDTLDAAFDIVVSAGTYFLSVQGVGKADVYGGYSDYGSLGQYTVDLKVQSPIVGLPVPAVSVDPVSVTEGNAGAAPASFTVRLSEPTMRLVRVAYATVDGTASTADGDYAAVSGVLSFAPGETVKTVTVPVQGDGIGEANESFSLQLKNAVNATIATPVAECTIRDDDLPSLFVDDASVIEGNGGTPALVFNVRLSVAATDPISVDFSTLDGSALAAADYTARFGSLLFLPGETAKPVIVPVLPDTTGEFLETMQLVLANPVNASFGRASAVGTIRDDDAPTARVVGGPVSEGDAAGGRTASFTVSLSVAPATTATVRYTTVDGTAVARKDYMPASGSIVFGPTRTTATILVRIVGDAVPEADETFSLQLTGGTGISIDPTISSGTSTIVDDDGREFRIAGPAAAVTEGQSAVFTISLSSPSPLPTTIRYATADRTASSARRDYQSTTGSLTFAPGETTKIVTVTTLADAAAEGAEQFFVRLLSPSGAIVSRTAGSATGEIRDSVVVPAAMASEARAATNPARVSSGLDAVQAAFAQAFAQASSVDGGSPLPSPSRIWKLPRAPRSS